MQTLRTTFATAAFALASCMALANTWTDSATGITWTYSISGGKATTEAQLEQVKENLKQVLGLQGATSLDAAAFSSDNVDLTFGTPVDGKVKFTAGPKATTDTFFMKVNVK